MKQSKRLLLLLMLLMLLMLSLSSVLTTDSIANFCLTDKTVVSHSWQTASTNSTNCLSQQLLGTSICSGPVLLDLPPYKTVKWLAVQLTRQMFVRGISFSLDRTDFELEVLAWRRKFLEDAAAQSSMNSCNWTEWQHVTDALTGLNSHLFQTLHTCQRVRSNSPEIGVRSTCMMLAQTIIIKGEMDEIQMTELRLYTDTKFLIEGGIRHFGQSWQTSSKASSCFGRTWNKDLNPISINRLSTSTDLQPTDDNFHWLAIVLKRPIFLRKILAIDKDANTSTASYFTRPLVSDFSGDICQAHKINAANKFENEFEKCKSSHGEEDLECNRWVWTVAVVVNASEGRLDISMLRLEFVDIKVIDLKEKKTVDSASWQTSVKDSEVSDCFANISNRLLAQHLMKTDTNSPQWWLMLLETQIHVSYVIVRAEIGSSSRLTVWSDDDVAVSEFLTTDNCHADNSVNASQMGLQECKSELRAAIDTDYSQEESHAFCNCRVRRLLLLAASGGIHVFNVGLAPKLPGPSAEEGVKVTELKDSCWQVEISGNHANSANFTCESGTRQQNQCCFNKPAWSFMIVVENSQLKSKSGVVVRTRAPTPSNLTFKLLSDACGIAQWQNSSSIRALEFRVKCPAAEDEFRTAMTAVQCCGLKPGVSQQLVTVTATKSGFLDSESVAQNLQAPIPQPVISLVNSTETCIGLTWQFDNPLVAVTFHVTFTGVHSPTKIITRSVNARSIWECGLESETEFRVKVVAKTQSGERSFAANMDARTELITPEIISVNTTVTCARIAWLESPNDTKIFTVNCSQGRLTRKTRGIGECCQLPSSSEISLSITASKQGFVKSKTVVWKGKTKIMPPVLIATGRSPTGVQLRWKTDESDKSVRYSLICLTGPTVEVSNSVSECRIVKATPNGLSIALIYGYKDGFPDSEKVAWEFSLVLPEPVVSVTSYESSAKLSWPVSSVSGIHYSAKCILSLCSTVNLTSTGVVILGLKPVSNNLVRVTVSAVSNYKTNTSVLVKVQTKVPKPMNVVEDKGKASETNCLTVKWDKPTVKSITFTAECVNATSTRQLYLKVICCYINGKQSAENNQIRVTANKKGFPDSETVILNSWNRLPLPVIVSIQSDTDIIRFNWKDFGIKDVMHQVEVMNDENALVHTAKFSAVITKLQMASEYRISLTAIGIERFHKQTRKIEFKVRTRVTAPSVTSHRISNISLCYNITWTAVSDSSVNYDVNCPTAKIVNQSRSFALCCEFDRDRLTQQVTVIARKDGFPSSRIVRLLVLLSLPKPDLIVSHVSETVALIQCKSFKITDVTCLLKCGNQSWTERSVLDLMCRNLQPGSRYVAYVKYRKLGLPLSEVAEIELKTRVETPRDFKAVADTDGCVTLTWTASSDLKVEYKVDCSSGVIDLKLKSRNRVKCCKFGWQAMRHTFQLTATKPGFLDSWPAEFKILQTGDPPRTSPIYSKPIFYIPMLATLVILVVGLLVQSFRAQIVRFVQACKLGGRDRMFELAWEKRKEELKRREGEKEEERAKEEAGGRRKREGWLQFAEVRRVKIT